MDRKVSEIMQKVHTLYEVCDGEESLMKVYDDWAEEYDADVESLLYTLPVQVARKLVKCMKPGPDVAVLDVGCGTGLLGEFLRKEKYHGQLHGLDGSAEMLKVARDKGVYDDLFTQYLTPGETVKAATNAKYDALVCVGAVTKNHLNPLLVHDFLDVMKPGAVMLISVMDTSYNAGINEKINQILKALQEDRKVEEVEVTKLTTGLSVDEKEVPDTLNAEDFLEMAVNLYLCRKI